MQFLIASDAFWEVLLCKIFRGLRSGAPIWYFSELCNLNFEHNIMHFSRNNKFIFSFVLGAKIALRGFKHSHFSKKIRGATPRDPTGGCAPRPPPQLLGGASAASIAEKQYQICTLILAACTYTKSPGMSLAVFWSRDLLNEVGPIYNIMYTI